MLYVLHQYIYSYMQVKVLHMSILVLSACFDVQYV